MRNDLYSYKIFLKSIGLTNKEADVYLSLLELGKGKVSDISRKANINRTTGYDILDSLVNKELVSVSGKKPRQEYSAESPEKIKAHIEKKITRENNNLRNSEKQIPKLKLIYNKGDRPKVRFYEGKAGLKQVYEDTLTSSEPIRAYATVDDMHKALPGYFPKYYKRRAKKGIKIRGIIPRTKAAIERSRFNEAEEREMALVPPEQYYFSPEINIYDNKVMIASWREELAIVIESKEISDAMKKIYELAWQQAKRYNSDNQA